MNNVSTVYRGLLSEKFQNVVKELYDVTMKKCINQLFLAKITIDNQGIDY